MHSPDSGIYFGGSASSSPGSGDQFRPRMNRERPMAPMQVPYYPTMPIFVPWSQDPMLYEQPGVVPTLPIDGQLPGLFDQSVVDDGNYNYYQVPNATGETGVSAEETGFFKAVVEQRGYISLQLRFDVQVDIAPNKAIRITNHRKGIMIALSGCGTQMALVHPQGRVLQYNARIEIQSEDLMSVKNAKMWPRGISFTASNCSLVYLVDNAGARSTTDTFHDLYTDNTADTIFYRSIQFSHENLAKAVSQSIEQLEKAEYWNTESELNCWLINDIKIKQTLDGLVTVEREYGREMFTFKTSPSNGKARMQSSFIYVTASMGDESHIFVKSNERRLHYNGKSFVVRNVGHSAGFDETGLLKIW